MEKILLPTDFSVNARNAARYGIELFAFAESYHLLLHSYEVPAGSSSMLISIKDILKKESLLELEKLKSELEEEFYPYILDIDYLAEYGDVASSVNTVAEFAKVDLVVMGTKGSSGLRELIMGSNTYSVIKKISKPVLAVPEAAKFSEMKRILLVTDYHKVKDPSIFNILNRLCAQYNSALTVAHVQSESNDDKSIKEGKEQLVKHLKGKESIEFVQLQGDNIISSIAKYMENDPPDMLCVIAQKHTYFEKMFHKSITKNLAMNPVTPLLVLKDY